MENMVAKCPLCESQNAELHLQLKDYFLSKEDFEIYRCQNCGLLYTWPRPADDIIEKYYKSEDYLSHNEKKKGLIPFIYNCVKRVNVANKFRMATKGVQGQRMLDFGCGVGDFLHFAQQKGYEVTGSDVSEDARHFASEKLGKTVISPDDVFAMPDNSFDIITMWHVLEHISDLKKQAALLDRLLADGGRLVIALPNYQSYDAQYYKDKWAAYDVPRHLNHFNQKTLETVFAGTKLHIISVRPLKWDAYYISMMSEGYIGSGNAFVKGILTGLKSNRAAHKSGQYSSMVYIFEK